MNLTLKRIQGFLQMKFMDRFLLSSCLLLISLTDVPSIHADNLAHKQLAETFENQESPEGALNSRIRNRRSRNCFQCVGPRGEEGCPGPRGTPGVGGLANFAAFELYGSPTGPVVLTATDPIPFGSQTVLVGDAIQSASPFNTFTLEPGDYQIDVGLTNATGGTLAAQVMDLEVLVYLNGSLLFSWPATPNPIGTGEPPFVAFSTIINVPTSSGTLQIIPSEEVIVTAAGPATSSLVIAYINILKLDPPAGQ